MPKMLTHCYHLAGGLRHVVQMRIERDFQVSTLNDRQQ
jgi:hypothetical protein